MIADKFKAATLEWFGACDSHCINYMIFMFMGVWTLRKVHIQHSKLYLGLHGFFKFFVLVTYAWTIFTMVYEGYCLRNDFEKLNYSLSLAVFGSALMCRYIAAIPQIGLLEDAFHFINNHFYLPYVGVSKRDKKMLDEAANFVDKFAKWLWFFTLLVIVMRCVLHTTSVNRMFMVPLPFVDPNTTPYFGYIFAGQIVLALQFLAVQLTYEAVTCGFFARIIKHYDIMKCNIMEIRNLYSDPESGTDEVKNEVLISVANPVKLIKHRLFIEKPDPKYHKWREEKANIMIKRIIIHHQNILRLINTMNILFGKSFFIEIFCGGIMISMLLVDAFWSVKKFSSKTLIQTLYALTTFVDVSIICLFGGQVEGQSHKTATVLYDIPWTLMGPETRKKIVFFIMKLKNPPILRGGNFLPLNYKTYVKFVNLIYNVVAFMLKASSAIGVGKSN